MDIHPLCYELLCRPLGEKLMLGSQMFCVGRVLILAPVTRMLGNEFMPVIHFHALRCVKDFYCFADILVRNTVVVSIYS